MQADVYQLPAQALAVQSLSARGEAPYLEAFEELRAAVHMTIAENSLYLESAPMWRPVLTVVCYTGARKHDGRYRPETVPTLLEVLHPIYAALMDAGVIADRASLYGITAMLLTDSPREGFRIRVTDTYSPQEGMTDDEPASREPAERHVG